MATQENQGRPTLGEIAQIAAPVTAVIAIFTSLAVAGILGQAQRNHGDSLAWAFGLVIGGAALWFIAFLLPPLPENPKAVPRMWSVTKWIWESESRVARALQWIRIRADVILKLFAVGFLVAGILWGIRTLIKTQQDFERPAISASFTKDSSVLNATVTDRGLASGRRLAVLVQVLKEKNGQLTPDPNSLYFSVLGPGEDGKVDHSVSVYVPRKADLVRVKAWTGKTDSGCTSFEETVDTVTTNLRPGEQAGCLLLRLPERTR